jgi:hypothetical protein
MFTVRRLPSEERETGARMCTDPDIVGSERGEWRVSIAAEETRMDVARLRHFGYQCPTQEGYSKLTRVLSSWEIFDAEGTNDL